MHIRFPLILSVLVALDLNASAQVATAENGLSVNPGNNAAQLGGSLLQTTTIDLGTGNNLHIRKGADFLFSINNTGNLGIGTNSPGGRLSFTNVDQTEEAMGVTWYNPNNTAYAIHRTGGAWTAPDYQQLRISWNTGIILDPGVSYGKSYIDVVGSGLRVTQGSVGIGTTTPGNKLSIATSIANTSGLQFVNLSGMSPGLTGNGKVLSVDNNGHVILVNDIGGANSIWALTGNSLTDPAVNFIGTADAQPIVFRTDNQSRARILANGNMIIGAGTISDHGYKLTVDGNIRTRKVRVDTDTWADFVFDNNYQLLPLKELEQYIQQEKHLPDVPSAAEVKKNGLDLSDNQAVLLKKIEELTLYVIEQNKKIEELQKQVSQQKK